MRLGKPFLTVLFCAAVALPACADIITWDVTINDAQQVPPHGSPGTGQAHLILDDVAMTLDLNMTFTGLLAPTTNAHIHCCATPGANAGVIIPFVPEGFPLGVTSGSFAHLFTLDSTQVGDLLSGMSYINIHTELFPGGEIRGNIVPEPATVGLFSAGLAGLLLLGRRRLKG